jgi:cell division protein ZapE
MLERGLDVLEVDAGADYRLRQLRRAPVYLLTTDPLTTARLASLFAELAGVRAERARHIELNGRTLTAYKRSGGVIWFGFASLCESARSAIDYAELAQDFHTIFVTDIPLLTASRDDAARRLIIMVDEFYDRGVKLVVSAAAGPAELYRGERLSFDFQRTSSRLAEMQSEDYLAGAHLKSMD